jgi:hypothetical protein
MQMSPSWEATNCAATQEFPNILWDPRVHYRVHNRPPLVLILGHINAVHTTLSYLLRSILILFTHVVRVVSFLLAFPPKSYMHASSPHCATCSAHLLLLDLITLIRPILVEGYMLWNSSLCSFPQPPVSSSLFCPNILLRAVLLP